MNSAIASNPLTTTPDPGVRPIGELIGEVIPVIEERFVAAGMAGVRTGFYDLDELIGGLPRGSLTLVAGPPAVGKTAMVLAVARAAARNSAPVLFATNESSDQTVAVRLLASETALEGIRLRDGRLRNSDWYALGRGVDVTEQLALHVIDGVTTVDRLRQAAQSTANEHGTLGLIVLDRVDPLLRDAEMTAITELAGDLSVPLVTTGSARLLARGDQSTSGRPTSCDSVEICDVAITLRRSRTSASDIATLDVELVKNRFGPTAVIQVLMRTSVPLLLNATEMDDPGIQIDDENAGPTRDRAKAQIGVEGQ